MNNTDYITNQDIMLLFERKNCLVFMFLFLPFVVRLNFIATLFLLVDIAKIQTQLRNDFA